MARTFRLLRRSVDRTYVVSRYRDEHAVQIIVSLPDSIPLKSNIELVVTEPGQNPYTASINWAATQRLRGDIDAYQARQKES